MRKRTSKSRGIEFHFTYLLVGVGFVLTGNFLSLVAFTFLILIHEFGHFIMAILCRVKIKKIIIYPFGGMTKLDCFVNFDTTKELLIAFSGVIMQTIGYFIICFLGRFNMVREYTLQVFTFYHFKILFFNLIPIYPLDGGRIVLLLLQKIFPFRVSNMISVISSFLFIAILVINHIYKVNYSNIIIYYILLYYLIKFFNKRHFYYSKFLLERYLYNFNFHRLKIINDYKYMYKDRLHFIHMGNSLIKEKDFLKIYFNGKR